MYSKTVSAKFVISLIAVMIRINAMLFCPA